MGITAEYLGLVGDLSQTHHFVSGCQYGHLGPAVNLELGDALGGNKAEVRRTQRPARGQDLFQGFYVLAGPADIGPFFDRPREKKILSFHIGIFDHYDGVNTIWYGRSSHDPDRFGLHYVGARQITCSYSADNWKGNGSSSGGSLSSQGGQCEAVHG